MRHVLRRNRLRLGLAALAAGATGLVLVGVLSGDEPAGSPEDGGGRDGGHAAPHASGDPRAATPAPGAKSPGGGGDEGEHEWSVYVVGRGGGRPRLTAPTPSEVPVTPAWSRRTDLIAFVRPGCEDCDAALW